MCAAAAWRRWSPRSAKRRRRARPSRPWQLLARALNDSVPVGARRGVQVGAEPANRGRRRSDPAVRPAEHPCRRSAGSADRGDGPGRTSRGPGTCCWSSTTTPTRRCDPKRSSSPSRSKDLPPLEAGLASQYADVRLKAVEALVKKHTPAAQDMARYAPGGPGQGGAPAGARRAGRRRRPRASGRGAGEAARRRPCAGGPALARHGDAAALAPLLALATAPEPEERERQADWWRWCRRRWKGSANWAT